MKWSYDSRKEMARELETVKVIEEGDIVIRANMRCGDESITEMEKKLSERFGRKVIVLDDRFGEILVVPPEKCPAGSSQAP